LAEGLGLTGADIKISDDIDWNDKRVATTGQGIIRVLA
jgi:hypothetical protein